MNATQSPRPTSSPTPEWYRLTAEEVAAALEVDTATGLSPDVAAARLAEHGPNRLAEARKRSKWLAFLGQFKDFLIIILLIAAVVSFVVSRELKTPIVVLVVVLFNAVVGFIQENRAERSLDALKKMLVTNAKVRRGGQVLNLPAEELVPGDVALVEAGDRVPADGRLVFANTLEVEEAALTGESHPVPKQTAAIDQENPPLGDRSNVVFMNTTVTRGRGELVVTGTGMATEIGKIAGLLRETEQDRSPLQKQLDHLAHRLARLAGLIVVVVAVIGLVRGQSFSDVFLTAVALAVASIPEGLPAVTVVTLAVGVALMARQGAIVKRLASVETLGSTSVICSDKTGTLTLNQMTARMLYYRERRHTVSGEGYDLDGIIRHFPGESEVSLDDVLLPMVLCNDASVRNGEIVGDPTEAALVVLAAKGGLDIDEVRVAFPRWNEVPFDSANKYMATFHRLDEAARRPVVRCYVKGGPDVVMGRCDRAVGADGTAAPMAALRARFEEENDRLAEQGLRVLAVAYKDYDPDDFDPEADYSGDIQGLTLLGLAGIVDPPRPEARQAIAEATSAGITVKMITGDHAATAAAIGKELGLHGRAVSGTELDRMSDAELVEQIDDIAVFARVSPQHKLKLVKVLKQKGNIVAMTGDGVNDAPALKTADIGVAMGITGTDVTKEAATMVLTDDNFATIVRAVKQGRAIYDNIVKFVQFQLSTTIGFAITFLMASILNVAGGKPFTAIQILWVNIVMDGPPAMALGIDRPADEIMMRRPRPIDERILNPSRFGKILFASVIMAAGTLGVLAWGPGYDGDAHPTEAGSMAFATFILFQFFNILNVRTKGSVFSRYTFSNGKLWAALGGVILLQLLATYVDFFRKIFDTVELSAAQWAVCVAVASSILFLEEARKLAARTLAARRSAS